MSTPHPIGWPLYHYRAVALRAVDGDTLEVRISVGLDIYTNQHLRIAGFDAPESNGPDSERATAAKKALEEMTMGRTLYIKTYKDKRSFTRYVADVAVADATGGLADVATAMVRLGHIKRPVPVPAPDA